MYEQELEDRGFTIRRCAVDESTLQRLEAAVARFRLSPDGRRRRGDLFGMRNVLARIPEIAEFARSETLRRIVEPVLGDGAAAVRGLYFDKTRSANWRLGWHQDKAIAVKKRVEVPGYGPWSVKAGVAHVFAPRDLLREILTVRLHLDSCDEANGALRVIPGTHRYLGLEETDFRRLSEEIGVITCRVERGDAVIMRPLIAHASEKSENPSHRRIIHIEYAANRLPQPLEWSEYVLFEQQTF
jgi:hypothetical protein